jgi:bifunctional DNA-binding transcriptional regulator/antitoxin component of YhaV-PrlF toxin-antitoxin module
MGNSSSTITAKWQVTIPEQVRRDLPFKIGQRLVWKAEGDKLVGQRVCSLKELAGCLKPGAALHKKKNLSAGFAKAAIDRHERISRQKP